ncbi:MAG: hypothetical protein MMC23_003181 [Stictis urceolatum]|nr:hypothetical protein [Stictis urceolata]
MSESQSGEMSSETRGASLYTEECSTASSRDVRLRASPALTKESQVGLDRFPMAPDSESISVRHASQPRAQHPCECISILASFVEDDLHWDCNMILVDMLAFHKQCVTETEVILKCKACSSRRETSTFLVLAYEKLVALSEKVVDVYLKVQREVQERDDSWPASSAPQNHAIGRYSIDDVEVFECVMQALAIYQIRVLGRQLFRLRIPASPLLRGGQLFKLATCEGKMQKLAESLQML